MPIPPELARYGKEAPFTDELLIPLLQRLGFNLVVNNHGQREFGRDVVFAEVDRFGHVVYHALQAKYVPVINLGSASRDVIEDANQAFENPFVHKQTGTKHRISVFYFVNAGSIPDATRDSIYNAVHPKFGANVRLIDGPGVVALDRLATFTRDSYVKERLTGLILELRYNRRVFAHVRPSLASFAELKEIPCHRCRTNATLSMLEQPVGMTAEEIESLSEYWQAISMISICLSSALMPLANGAQRASEALGKVDEAMATGDQLEPVFLQKLDEIGATLTGL